MVDTHEMRLAHMRRRLDAWAYAVNDMRSAGKPLTFIGVRLSYREVGMWQPNDINNLMRSVKRLLGHKLLAYAWVAELQERGAVHYHATFIIDGFRYKLPFFDVPIPIDPDHPSPLQGQTLWPHGYTHFDYLQNVSGRYLVKYGEKSLQKRDEFPKGLRMFAVVICDRWSVNPRNFFEYRVAALPAYVREKVRSMMIKIGFLNDFQVFRPWRMRRIEVPGWRWRPMPDRGGWLIEFYNYFEVAISEYKFLGIEGQSYSAPEQEWAVEL